MAGTKENPWIINTAAEFDAIRNDASAYYRLGSNIDLVGITGFVPFPIFSGGLDGNNFTISNLSIPASGTDTALFRQIINYGEIKNLIINNFDVSATSHYSGVLAGKTYECLIENLTVLNSSVFSTNLYVGGLIAGVLGDTIIKNSSFSGTVSSNSTSTGQAIGGIFGTMSAAADSIIFNSHSEGLIDCFSTGRQAGGFGGNINNQQAKFIHCHSTAEVIIAAGRIYAGGFVGYAQGGHFIDCYATGKVTGGRYVGGFSGSSTDNADYTLCYATGEVVGLDSLSTTGGFVGYGTSYFNACYATGNVTGLDDTGGFIGASGLASRFFHCYAKDGEVFGGARTGGFIGNTATSIVIFYNCWVANNVISDGTDNNAFKGNIHTSPQFYGCFYNSETTLKTDLYATPKTTAELMSESTYMEHSEPFEYIAWSIEEGVSYPYLNVGFSIASVNDYWEVYDLKTLNYVRYMVGLKIQQTADIDASIVKTWRHGRGFVPIGGLYYYMFITYYGNNHKISNLFISAIDGYNNDRAALFGRVNIRVYDLTTTNSMIQGEWGAGIVGQTEGAGCVIDNCHSVDSVILSYGSYTAGIIGRSIGSNDLILNCHSNNTIYAGSTLAGGITGGTAAGTVISNCHYSGFLSGSGTLGGITSVNLGLIEYSTFNGKVITTAAGVGGIARTNEGRIQYCRSSGDLLGTSFIGGIAGVQGNTGTPALIQFCYSDATIFSLDRGGGIAGLQFNHSYISNCYSESKIYAMSGGGICGSLQQLLTRAIYNTNNYFNGEIAAPEEGDVLFGRLIAVADPDLVRMENNYFNKEKIDSSDERGRTTNELMLQSTFENWNFNSAWNIEEGINMPTLLDLSNFYISGYVQNPPVSSENIHVDILQKGTELKKTLSVIDYNYKINNLSPYGEYHLVGRAQEGDVLFHSYSLPNLEAVEEIVPYEYPIGIELFNGTILAMWFSNNTNFTMHEYTRTTIIKVQPDQQYSLLGTDRLAFRWIGEDWIKFGFTNMGNDLTEPVTVTVPQNAEFLEFYYQSSATSSTDPPHIVRTS